MKNTPMNQGVTVAGDAKHITDNMYSGATQIAWACKALLEGRTITHATEFMECKGWRLSGIVYVLIHKHGWPIITELRGKGNIGHYFLETGLDIGKLELPRSAKRLLMG